MTWRKCPFTKGTQYRVKKEVIHGFWVLKAGDMLQYESEDWSRIDGASIYYFRNSASQESVQWWLWDDDPLESWEEVFEKCGAQKE